MVRSEAKRTSDAKRSEAATVDIGEAAKRIGKSRQTVRRLIAAGRLSAERTRSAEQYTRDKYGRELRGHWRIDARSLEAYLAKLAAKSAKLAAQQAGENRAISTTLPHDA
jgi:excisionase family DNA binding protein